MAVTKPYTFKSGTKARANEVNQDFDVLYSEVNKLDTTLMELDNKIDRIEEEKANLTGNSENRFQVADAINKYDAVNKQTLDKFLGNIKNHIDGMVIKKVDKNTILVTKGSCYDSKKEIVIILSKDTQKQNASQGANTTYYVYAISDDSGLNADVLISTQQTTPNLPSGFTKFRYIGKYTTNGSSEIKNIYSSSGSQRPNQTSNLVTTYYSGSNGYRIYSDGYCEQWGTVIQKGSGWRTVTLFKNYNGDSTYNVSCTLLSNSGRTDVASNNIGARYANRFDIHISDNVAVGWMWITRGKLATGQY